MADNRKNILIVGGGAAGMSCANQLAQHPDRFKVTIIERMNVCGGQATSISLDKEKYGTTWMNDGVQGGSGIFKHTFHYFEQYGHKPQPIRLQIAFGQGETFWTNCFPSQLVDKHSKDIKKFGKVLKLIKWFMPILGLVPVRMMLKIFMFNKDFGDQMVYPLIALFLGTGNQTANVASAILERLFDDPNMKLWDYSPETLLPNLPLMYTFPKLHDFYADWAEDLKSKGVDIRLETDVVEVKSRSKEGVVITYRHVRKEVHDDPSEVRGKEVLVADAKVIEESFDEMVLCILADDAKRLLGKTATWKENFVLGGAMFYDDITVTHSDSKYFSEHFETHLKEELIAEPKSEDEKKQIAFSRGEAEGPDGETPGYRPMYYTRSYKEDPKLIEMAFDVSNYQHQFRMDHNAPKCPMPHDKHVFQSIFLNKEQEHLWSRGAIDPDKIILEKWWHQLGHRWQHYVRVVPGMMFLNGHNSTWFGGSWTLVNMHEMACVSGIAVAYRLGAKYEHFDDFAEDLLKKYLLLSHGVLYKRGKNA